MRWMEEFETPPNRGLEDDVYHRQPPYFLGFQDYFNRKFPYGAAYHTL